ncbi:MAG: hypothetical protein ACOC0P_00815 [Planctomycetota bacterium]
MATVPPSDMVALSPVSLRQAIDAVGGGEITRRESPVRFLFGLMID